MFTRTIIQRTLRVPRGDGPPGDGAAVARQLDAVLAGVGFAADRALLEHLSGLASAAAMDRAVDVVEAVRALVGDHVQHNVYFRDFPHGVPDTVDFWVQSLRALVAPDATTTPTDADLIDALASGRIGLLDLPGYGTYQHSYPDLVATRDDFLASVKDRVTVLHLGATPEEETRALYRELATSPTPLGEADLALFAELAAHCVHTEPPQEISSRENRAVVNAARLAAGLAPVAVDTVLDVLRMACQASGGDVTLAGRTRLRSFTRRERRVLLAALHRVVEANTGKLGDVARYAGPFKRLGELLHPHEYPQFPEAAAVFAVARGDRTVRSLAARAELAFAAGENGRAVAILATAPGMLLRSLDRLLRTADGAAEVDAVLDAMAAALGSVSGRVLCAVREQLANRARPDAARVFINRARRAWVIPDTRAPLPPAVIERATALLDAELSARLPAHERLVVDPAVLALALPLSGKATEDGFAVLPRGTRTPLDDDADTLCLFTYWRQRAERTDYDLSALLLDESFRYSGHISWTNYNCEGAVYSGDITEAPDGATEFIDIPLHGLQASYIVAQVNIYGGEGFDSVAESLFGWMVRDRAQRGMPFEARTVRARSDMRGTGRVALPVLFGRDADGAWSATWLHLYLNGAMGNNQLEDNEISTNTLARSVVQREYLTVGYLVEMLRAKAGRTSTWDPDVTLTEPVTYLGLHRPEGLPEGSTVITLDRLNQLIPG